MSWRARVFSSCKARRLTLLIALCPGVLLLMLGIHVLHAPGWALGGLALLLVGSLAHQAMAFGQRPDVRPSRERGL